MKRRKGSIASGIRGACAAMLVLALCASNVGCGNGKEAQDEAGQQQEANVQAQDEAGQQQETNGKAQDEAGQQPEANGQAQDEPGQQPEANGNVGSGEDQDEEQILRLAFAGDVNLDENWATTQFLDTQPNGIYDCIDSEIIDYTNACDIFMLNNEFSYSDRGTPMDGKAYTFRAKPERVGVIQALGTDIVLLANNHVFDYGADAFYDTLDTLENAGIPYVGAGRDIQEACRPIYFDRGDIRIAYVAATRAEKLILTPEADEDHPGVLRAYDEGRYLEVIKNAAEQADYVVASIHFGTEYSNHAEEYQRELAKEMIDAGADAVIGSHAHVLQGIEFYEGKPIIYNLGNFWFNEKTLNSCVFEIDISDRDAALKGVKMLPCIQSGCRTELVEGSAEQREFYDFVEQISFGIAIDQDGNVSVDAP